MCIKVLMFLLERFGIIIYISNEWYIKMNRWFHCLRMFFFAKSDIYKRNDKIIKNDHYKYEWANIPMIELYFIYYAHTKHIENILNRSKTFLHI